MSQFPVLSLHQFDEHGVEQEFYVNRFSEHLRKFHADVLRPHKHDFYVCILFTQGTGFHEIDFKRYDVQPGSIFFLQPGQTHHWAFSDDIEGYILFHSLHFYQLHYPQQKLTDFSFFFSTMSRPLLQLSKTDSELPKTLFAALLDEFPQKASYKYQKIAGILSWLYIELARSYRAIHVQGVADHHRYATRLLDFTKLLETHFRSEKSPQFYADQLSLSTKHLNRICQESLGKTSTEVIADRVVLEAKRLLSAGELQLNEIGYALGFEEYSYFSRFFKQHCHETPRDFRKRYG